MKRIFAIGLILFLITSAAEAKDEWVTIRANSPICNDPPGSGDVKGDFDGNGKPDLARLQMNEKTKRRRILVYFNGATSPIIADEVDGKTSYSYLKPVKPGTVTPYADSEDTKPVHIPFDALETGACEATSSIYYWDKSSKKFKTIWTGD